MTIEVKNDAMLGRTTDSTLHIELMKLQQENKILRENAENNDKVVDKVNWENMLLKKKYENAVSDYETTMSELQELRKQLEEYKDKINWYENFEINKVKRSI